MSSSSADIPSPDDAVHNDSNSIVDDDNSLDNDSVGNNEEIIENVHEIIESNKDDLHDDGTVTDDGTNIDHLLNDEIDTNDSNNDSNNGNDEEIDKKNETTTHDIPIIQEMDDTKENIKIEEKNETIEENTNEIIEETEEKKEKKEKKLESLNSTQKLDNNILEIDNSIPKECWHRNLTDPIKEFSQFQVSYGQMVKLVGLGIRMNKFVNKTRKEGKEPFMDPFLSPLVTSSRGVPCGGIGCGSISRSWNGDFNCFYLNPGRPIFGTVKADQFSLYIKRQDLPSQSFVLGNPFNNTKKHQNKNDDNVILMPPSEPLPDFITSKIKNEENEENEIIIDESNSDIHNNSQSHEKLENIPVSTGKSKRPIKQTYIRPEAALQDWNWKECSGTYSGLFPRAWTSYNLSKYDKRLKITCKQISPVIPNNYKESSYPTCVFVWKVENTHPSKSIDISLMFTFQNGTGEVNDYTGGHFNQPFRSNLSPDSKFTGVELVNNNIKHCVENGNSTQYKDPLSFGIATTNPDKIHQNGDIEQITSQRSSAVTFQTTGHGDRLWKAFSLTGKAILPENSAYSTIDGIGIGSAVANKVTVEPNSTVEITFSLGWDQPIIRFGEGRGIHPRYTRFYGTSGHAVQKICEDSLENWRHWEHLINEWQNPILLNPDLPDWYKTALFNELYYIVAGGSLWIDQEESKASKNAHRIISDDNIHEQNKTENKKPLQEDKERATKVLEDFITLTQNIDKGIMIRNSGNIKSGRVIFSPNEIEENFIYLTENGNKLEKTKNGIVKLADRITLYPSSEPGSPPLSPRQTSSENNEENNENSLFDYGEYGMYLYLEGQEYLMYNTYDVHFYASFALISLWPELELNIQRNIAKSTLIHCPSDIQLMLHENELKPRKLGGAVPHDVGTPSGDPLYTVNSYCIHDVNCWKDLNSKFTLQVYRDYIATNNIEFLEQVYPMVWQSMHYLERFDVNRDGMIENTGFPDQTYDTWTATGASAYCGGLWVAACSAMVEMSKILNKEDDYEYYQNLLKKASIVYDTLWNGEYMRYDTSGKYDDIIMADQLAGQWYARASNLPPITNPENIKACLKTVFNHNVLKFHDGKLGAVNGFNKALSIPDYTSMQSSEVWTGTSFALAASLYQEGLEEEAWQVAHSLYDCIYNKFSYWYQTPEAWDESGRYRSYAYMRPLAIWSIQWAIENKQSNNE